MFIDIDVWISQACPGPAVNKFVAGKPRASSELALARDCRAAPRPWVRPIATLFVNWRLELRILADH